MLTFFAPSRHVELINIKFMVLKHTFFVVVAGDAFDFYFKLLLLALNDKYVIIFAL
jgi:hypothetical protein